MVMSSSEHLQEEFIIRCCIWAFLLKYHSLDFFLDQCMVVSDIFNRAFNHAHSFLDFLKQLDVRHSFGRVVELRVLRHDGLNYGD